MTCSDGLLLDHVINKKADIVRVYLPPDANCLLSRDVRNPRDWVVERSEFELSVPLTRQAIAANLRSVLAQIPGQVADFEKALG